MKKQENAVFNPLRNMRIKYIKGKYHFIVVCRIVWYAFIKKGEDET